MIRNINPVMSAFKYCNLRSLRGGTLFSDFFDISMLLTLAASDRCTECFQHIPPFSMPVHVYALVFADSSALRGVLFVLLLSLKATLPTDGIVVMCILGGLL